MGKRETVLDQDPGESKKPASWFVSIPPASELDLPTGTVFPTGTVHFLFTEAVIQAHEWSEQWLSRH